MAIFLIYQVDDLLHRETLTEFFTDEALGFDGSLRHIARAGLQGILSTLPTGAFEILGHSDNLGFIHFDCGCRGTCEWRYWGGLASFKKGYPDFNEETKKKDQPNDNDDCSVRGARGLFLQIFLGNI